MRDIIRNVLREERKPLVIPNLNVLYGDFDLEDKERSWNALINHAKNREIIFNGNLDLRFIDIESLGTLTEVKGFLDLRGLEVRSLNNLRKVGGNLYLEDSLVTSLDKLKTLGGLSGGGELRDLGDIKIIKGDVDLMECYQLNSLNNLSYVGSSLSLSTDIKDLGELEYIGNTIFAYYSTMKSLKKLKYVGKDVILKYSQIESLGDLEKVGGNLDAQDTKLKSIGNLKHVEGNLDLTDTEIDSVDKLLGLEYVGGSMSLIKTPLAKSKSLDELEEIDDMIRKNCVVKRDIYL